MTDKKIWIAWCHENQRTEWNKKWQGSSVKCSKEGEKDGVMGMDGEPFQWSHRGEE